VRPTVDVTDRYGLAMAYTPGVARVCTAIAEAPELAAEYTWVSNTVAVVSDGTGEGSKRTLCAPPTQERG
jgi:malate dehydrogenase (oxaloacetate-decarboxylating)